LVVALYVARNSLCPVLVKIVFIFLCLNGFLAAPHKGITLLLDSGFKTGHLPLPVGGELLGVGLWKRSRRL
jgi:hypothetical protein